MRIYNKKIFTFGIVAILLALLNAITGILDEIDTETVILFLLLLFFGIGAIVRSLSHKWSKEDKLEELDERNQLVNLKSKSKSLKLTQIISFLLMLALLIAGKLSDEDSLLSIAIGLAFAFSISLFTEIATYCYYESHN